MISESVSKGKGKILDFGIDYTFNNTKHVVLGVFALIKIWCFLPIHPISFYYYYFYYLVLFGFVNNVRIMKYLFVYFFNRFSIFRNCLISRGIRVLGKYFNFKGPQCEGQIVLVKCFRPTILYPCLNLKKSII